MYFHQNRGNGPSRLRIPLLQPPSPKDIAKSPLNIPDAPPPTPASPTAASGPLTSPLFKRFSFALLPPPVPKRSSLRRQRRPARPARPDRPTPLNAFPAPTRAELNGELPASPLTSSFRSESTSSASSSASSSSSSSSESPSSDAESSSSGEQSPRKQVRFLEPRAEGGRHQRESTVLLSDFGPFHQMDYRGHSILYHVDSNGDYSF